jgi:SAM-dependent methyltransferase
MIHIDYDRMHEIIQSSRHGYYEREQCRFVREAPLALNIDEAFRRVCRPDNRVLDIGCGNARTLVRNASLFAEGVGLDNHPPHLRLAEQAVAASGAANVRIVEGRGDNLPFEPESFDFVFSERGPVAGNDTNTFNAVRVLRRGGTMLIETPGPLAYLEPGYIFDPNNVPIHTVSATGRLEALSAVMARNGIDMQLAASTIEKLVFEDFYEWLKFHLSAWDYYENWRFTDWPLPERQVHGIGRFLVMCADEQGRIRATNHRLWIGGAKR